MPNPTRLRLKSEQIADYLAAEMTAGRITPGDKLPSLDAIAEMFGVANNTAGAAVAELKRQGLVYTEHGRGTFARAA